MTTLYSCKSELNAFGIERYRITKFDGDMNVESSYIVAIGKGWAMTCDCPAGIRPSCRHRDMLPKFIARGAVNSMWFFDFDRSGWVSMDLEGESQGPDTGSNPEATAACLSPNELLNEIPYKDVEAYGTSPAMIGLPMLQKENERARADLRDVEVRRALSPSPEPSPSPSPLLRRF